MLCSCCMPGYYMLGITAFFYARDDHTCQNAHTDAVLLALIPMQCCALFGYIRQVLKCCACWQCRQKTVELKANCTTCPLHWCPRCLLNRYGEEVAQVLAADPSCF